MAHPLRQRIDPSPAEIASACRQYQASWSTNDRLERLGQRRGKHKTPGESLLPVMRRPARVLRGKSFDLYYRDET